MQALQYIWRVAHSSDGMRSHLTGERLVTNRALCELLAAHAEKYEARSQRWRALRRAARAAITWPQEASELMAAGTSLTALPRVGPWTAHFLAAWIREGVVPQEPPAERRDFRTLSDATGTLNSSYPVRGDLHMHTVDSDGHATATVMAEAGRERGYDYIALTDHSRGLRIAGGMDESAFRAQWREIAELNRAAADDPSACRILRGVEVNLDILGNADMAPEFLEECDLVVGALHSRLRRAEEQTDRLRKAFQSGLIDIIGHPRGRIFNFRKGIEADWDAVFECAAETGVAVEVDCYPDRQDLDIPLLRRAKRFDVFVSLGTDAHHPIDLKAMTLGINAVVEAGIPCARILNTMSLDALLAWRMTRRRRLGTA